LRVGLVRSAVALVSPRVALVSPEIAVVSAEIALGSARVALGSAEVALGVARVALSSAEIALSSAEIALSSAEITLVSAEITLVSPEITLVSPEITLVSPAIALVSAEITLVSPEITLVSAEIALVSPEITLVSAEAALVLAEVALGSARIALVLAEIALVSAYEALICAFRARAPSVMDLGSPPCPLHSTVATLAPPGLALVPSLGALVLPACCLGAAHGGLASRRSAPACGDISGRRRAWALTEAGRCLGEDRAMPAARALQVRWQAGALRSRLAPMIPAAGTRQRHRENILTDLTSVTDIAHRITTVVPGIDATIQWITYAARRFRDCECVAERTGLHTGGDRPLP